MKRRTFLGASLAAAIVPAIGISMPMPTPLPSQFNSILSSFPEVAPNSLAFFLTSVQASDSVSFTIFKKDTSTAVDIANFGDLIDGLDKVVVDGDLAFHHVIREASLIAKKTKRGAGNHVKIFDNGILVWYNGNVHYDSPLAVVDGDNGIILNDGAEKYFSFIEYDTSKLSKEFFTRLSEYKAITLIS